MSLQPLTPQMRAMLYVASALVFAVGVPLLFLANQTDTLFAWTITSPLTAAFLGSAYWSACVLEFVSARERLWVNARVAVPAVLLFTTLTLIVTLIHIDRFHLQAPLPLTVAGTWVWLAIYALVPPIMAVLLVFQLRTPGVSPTRRAPVPTWMRTLMGINATVMLVSGILLLIVPDAARLAWPWTLTTLTSRAVGAWLIGLGTATAHGTLENDLGRVRPVWVSGALFSVLQGIALARYGNELNWGSASTWIYIALLANILVLSAYGIRRVAHFAPSQAVTPPIAPARS